VDEALLEARVLGEAEAAVGVEGRWVVGSDVEDDLVARAEELGGTLALNSTDTGVRVIARLPIGARS